MPKELPELYNQTWHHSLDLWMYDTSGDERRFRMRRGDDLIMVDGSSVMDKNYKDEPPRGKRRTRRYSLTPWKDGK